MTIHPHTTVRPYSTPKHVSQHMPYMPRAMLTTAAAVQDPELRLKAIADVTDIVRKGWPEYFQPGN